MTQAVLSVATVLWRRGARLHAARLLAASCVEAEIPVPPRRMSVWLGTVVRRLRALEGDVAQAEAALRKVLLAPNDLADDLGRALYRTADAAQDTQQELTLLRKAVLEFIDRLDGPLREIARKDAAHHIRAVLSHLQSYTDARNNPNAGGYQIGRIRSYLTYSVARDEDRIADALEAYRDDPEAQQLDDVTQAVPKLCDRFFVLTREVSDKLAAQLEEYRHSLKVDMDGEIGAGPRAKGQHRLYHATAFKPEILRDGWQAETPTNRTGLGNLGATQATVSFTYDLKVAKDIARTLKELTEVVNGRVTEREIVSWAEHEGIDLQKLRADAYSSSNKRSAAEGVEYTLALYNWYLAYNTVGRAHPVFTDMRKIVKTFHGRSERDVGVLSCEVDLDHPEVLYMPGEREFRVPVPAILSTKVLW